VDFLFFLEWERNETGMGQKGTGQTLLQATGESVWDSLLGGAEGGADGAEPGRGEPARSQGRLWMKFAFDWRAEFPDAKPQIPANKAEVDPLKHLVHPQPSTRNLNSEP